MIDHIRSSLRACFKGNRRLSTTTIDSLVKAVVSVALGLRVAHLIDVAHVTSDQINELIILLRQDPQCQQLLVLQFKDRYTFLCHRHELERHVEATLNQPNQWVYVDIRGKQGPPIQRPCPEIFLFWLQNRLQPYLLSCQQQQEEEKEKNPLYYSSVVPSYMVVLTGFLLEYPIMYMTHNETDQVDQELDEWEMIPNCLGDRSLLLVRVWLHQPKAFWHDYMLLSYSCPSEKLIDFPEQDPTIKKKNSVTMITPTKEVVIRNFETKFQTRFHQLEQTKKNGFFIKDTQLEISHEYVTLDRVAL
ncbi:hypothetical protein INT45_000737 [Circinella minor]|uniref:Uncharacterized protein n=1 Tax=Circinella minor TaxID=1195481 RepID=A0A8H7RZM7_9FUNG|nr:hypothetical protein INT45_000737 [Circinella minor]